jgi:hypothetical protein
MLHNVVHSYDVTLGCGVGAAHSGLTSAGPAIVWELLRTLDHHKSLPVLWDRCIQ